MVVKLHLPESLRDAMEGGPIMQPTLRVDQIRQDQSIFIAQKWEPMDNTGREECKNKYTFIAQKWE